MIAVSPCSFITYSCNVMDVVMSDFLIISLKSWAIMQLSIPILVWWVRQSDFLTVLHDCNMRDSKSIPDVNMMFLFFISFLFFLNLWRWEVVEGSGVVHPQSRNGMGVYRYYERNIPTHWIFAFSAFFSIFVLDYTSNLYKAFTTQKNGIFVVVML